MSGANRAEMTGESSRPRGRGTRPKRTVAGTKASAGRATSVDEYIASCPPEVRNIMRKIRATIRKAAPAAEETISYRMPTFKLHGVLVHFAAFKEHIGMFPPVQGDDELMKRIAVHAGPKGNLRFPLKERIPYGLIRRIVKTRMRQNLEKAARRGR